MLSSSLFLTLITMTFMLVFIIFFITLNYATEVPSYKCNFLLPELYNNTDIIIIEPKL